MTILLLLPAYSGAINKTVSLSTKEINLIIISLCPSFSDDSLCACAKYVFAFSIHLFQYLLSECLLFQFTYSHSAAPLYHTTTSSTSYPAFPGASVLNQPFLSFALTEIKLDSALPPKISQVHCESLPEILNLSLYVLLVISNSFLLSSTSVSFV